MTGGTTQSRTVESHKDVPDSERQYHTYKESIYPLPADTPESDRLGIQHRLIVSLFGGLLVPPIKEYVESHPKAKIVDIGCGPGDWSKDLKKLYPQTECHATDFAPTYVEDPEVDVEFRLGNLLTKLPYEDGEFDVVHMRMLVVALRADEWPQAIAEVVRITKPGGWIQLTELEVKFQRNGPLEGVVKDVEEEGQSKFFEVRGSLADAGHRLTYYLTKAGLPSATAQVKRGYFDRSDVGGTGEMAFINYYTAMRSLAPVFATLTGNDVEAERARGSAAMVEAERQGVWQNWITAWGQKAAA